ncbi:MAG: hypothetical protein JW827_06310 [Spirochaetes bacterium]|nr:hypothetical protein [Spirochaetota bacterium]
MKDSKSIKQIMDDEKVKNAVQKARKIKKFIIGIFQKYNLALSYTVISVLFLLIVAGFFMRSIGNFVLHHESFILKREFINNNKAYTKSIAIEMGRYFENLDTIGIVELISEISKRQGVAYAYVVDQNGEIIAHTLKSEMFKQRKDKFIRKNYLSYFIKNMDRVWDEETDYKGRTIITLSKPVILHFAKKDVLDELKHMQKSLSGNETETAQKIEKNFYIAGAFHLGLSLDKLDFIARSSRKRVRINYIFGFIFLFLIGYLVGKYFENIINRADKNLQAILNDEEVEPLKAEERIDSFKRLFNTINELSGKFSNFAESKLSKVEKIQDITDATLLELISRMDQGVLILNNHMQVEFVNQGACQILNKEGKKILGENIPEALDKFSPVFEKLNKMVTARTIKTEGQSIESAKVKFTLIPIAIKNRLHKVIILMDSGSDIRGSEKTGARYKASKIASEVKTKEKNIKKSESKESIINKRLKRI